MIIPTALRDHLVSSLDPLGNITPYNLSLTVLVSQPKKTNAIFPHTPHPPKCTQQEILVVLSSDLPNGERDEGIDATSASRDRSRVLVCAISAYLYNFPQSQSQSQSTASSSSKNILYISKVDSSGYAPSSPALPLTRHFIRSFLTHFLLTLPRIRIQLFARAQRQYLFANSGDDKRGKKVLGGTGLCKWWKGVYEDAVTEFAEKVEKSKAEASDEAKLRYILPGYEELEARTMLGQGRPLPSGVEWKYEPPFSEPLFASSSSSASQSQVDDISLATLIPSLPDDPKTRFLEELVSDTLPQHNNNNRSDINADVDKDKKTRKERDAADELQFRKNAHSALAKIPPKEFWERIGFRQECASGDVTGFFTLESRRESTKVAINENGDNDSSRAARNRATSNEEETTNLPTILNTDSSPSNTHQSSMSETTSVSKSDPIDKITNPVSITNSTSTSSLLPPAILSRLLTALTNLDFASLPLAKEGTELYMKSTRLLVISELGENAWNDCIGFIQGKGAGEGVNVKVGEKRVEAPVTMLQPRKKKKVLT